MTGIVDWLARHGLDKYKEVFVENDIDMEVLVDLTDGDLRELGMTLGHRKKCLKAISLEVDSLEDAQIVAPDAEHRQLTVMFCDLVDSTGLSQRVDPEDLRTVISTTQDAWKAEISRYEGFIARYMGDGLLAYFGYPQAHEEDPERAVRAGLALVQSMALVNSKLSQWGDLNLSVRVGIATGPVVVGNLVGEGSSEESPVLGKIPNLAARLQTLTEPDSVSVSSGTYRLTRHEFRFQDLGARSLKGIEGRERVWRVIAEAQSESRFAARHRGRLNELIGREEELQLLVARWHRATRGEGQLVFLTGEPGMGKSRLAESFIENVVDNDHIPMRFYCSPFHTTSPLYPVINQLRRGADISPDDSDDDKLQKVEALLRMASENVAAQVPFISSLLSIPYEKHYALPTLTPQAQRVNTLEVLLDHVEGLCETRPVIAIVEDLQWADPTTNELFQLLVNRLNDQPVLLLVTYRSGYEPAWTGHGAPVTTINLNPLTRDEGAAIIQWTAKGKRLPDELVEEILRKTDRIPLFLEELTQTIIESGQLIEHQSNYQLAESLPALVIPATLQDSLMARLDRLGAAKDIAQVGSVIGRRFTQDLLAHVATDNAEIDQALTRLMDSGLVVRQNRNRGTTYMFKHALVRDVAYHSLLRARRQELHVKIAQVVEEHYPQTAKERPETLAHHHTEGESLTKAVFYWEKAGRQALQNSSNQEALKHFRRGLEIVSVLPESDTRLESEIHLQTGLAGALINAKGLAAKELEGAYTRARDLCEQVDTDRQRFVIEWGLWHVYVGRSQLDRARELAGQLKKIAGKHGDQEMLLQSYHADWSVLCLKGHVDETIERCKQGWEIYDRDRHASQAFIYGGHDPGVCSRNQCAWALWEKGYPDSARECYQQGLALAQEIAHPMIVAHAYNWGGPLFEFMGDHQMMGNLARSALELANEQSLANYYTDATILIGWLTAQGGQVDEGLRLALDALSEREARGTLFLQPYYLSLIAQVNSSNNNHEEAIGLINKAIAQIHRGGETWIEPDLHRVKGDVLWQSGDRFSAEEEFKCAIALAKKKGSKAYELRAVKSLAKLWLREGKASDARNLITPVYRWFTEGLDTSDLLEARALLDELI